MKKLFSILLVILMLIGMLVSCNVDNTDTNTSTDTSTQTDTSTNTEETTPSVPRILQITDLPELDGMRYTDMTGTTVYYKTRFETLRLRYGGTGEWKFIDALYNSYYELVDDESSVNDSKYSFEILQYKDETFEMDILENETWFEISEYMEYESNTYVLKGEIVEWLDALVKNELYSISKADAVEIATTHFFESYSSRLNNECYYTARITREYPTLEIKEGGNTTLEEDWSIKYWYVDVNRMEYEYSNNNFEHFGQTVARYTISKADGRIKSIELYEELKPNN